MMEPIEVEFSVTAAPDHAFRMWTERTALWWPPGHTITKSGEVAITFEPRPGGRIYERAADGSEHDWGEILHWDPPHGLSYLWFLFFDRSEATEVRVSFTPTDGGTDVTLRQTGFDRLDAEVAEERRERTAMAWSSLAELYRNAAAG
jgi:uncharacterized protein YndB with AHSA1/START domain